METNQTLDIAIGHSAKTRTWENVKMTWPALVAKLREATVTKETYKSYISASKADQLAIKDVGGFVGGYLRAGKRHPQNVMHRQVLALDIDLGHPNLWEDFTLMFDFAAFIHSTHKHSEHDPRYRLIIPLSRECSPDEYMAVGRKIAGDIGIDLFDNTTFETNRLMFWPSVSKDMEYFFASQEGEFVDVDKVLASYVDWTDSSAWPTSGSVHDEVRALSKKVEDPLNKKGIIGAFCRTFSITEVIAKILFEEYSEAKDGRYTYEKGTTASGLVVYEDKFAFSHHGTDPCGGRLCNAFDLVRIHKFGHLDPDLSEGGASTKSFKAMEAFAVENIEVKRTLADERIDSATFDFATTDTEAETLEEEKAEREWMVDLDADAKGNFLSTSSNINLILSNDIRLKGAFRLNEFDNKSYVFRSLPWRRVSHPSPIRNVDFSGLRNYLECIYGITGVLKIEDSLSLEFERNRYHPIKKYISSLKWDGVPRVDTLLIDYFGAVDNVYYREAIRKTLVGAVARVYQPGTKFDLVLTLVGGQGVGKSTFVKKLGGEWFSDTFLSVNGKEALEQIQGAWIIEMAELSGLRKAEIEATKHFLSKSTDTFRPAYGRTAETYDRQCVFIGTTNNKEFLKDPTGNRRFMPVSIEPSLATRDIFSDLSTDEVGQIWAEAYQLYMAKEKLYLSVEATALAKIEQRDHSEADDRSGLIQEFLDTPLPRDWDTRDLNSRRAYLEDFAESIRSVNLEEKLESGELFIRNVVCVAEVWCECLGNAKEDMARFRTREVNDILRGLEGWDASTKTRRFHLYGTQKSFSRL